MWLKEKIIKGNDAFCSVRRTSSISEYWKYMADKAKEAALVLALMEWSMSLVRS